MSQSSEFLSYLQKLREADLEQATGFKQVLDSIKESQTVDLSLFFCYELLLLLDSLDKHTDNPDAFVQALLFYVGQLINREGLKDERDSKDQLLVVSLGMYITDRLTENHLINEAGSEFFILLANKEKYQQMLSVFCRAISRGSLTPPNKGLESQETLEMFFASFHHLSDFKHDKLIFRYLQPGNTPEIYQIVNRPVLAQGQIYIKAKNNLLRPVSFYAVYNQSYDRSSLSELIIYFILDPEQANISYQEACEHVHIVDQITPDGSTI